jgi:hypothetical protein
VTSVIDKISVSSLGQGVQVSHSVPKFLALKPGVGISICVALCFVSSSLPAIAQNGRAQGEVIREEKHDLSPPLRDIEPPFTQSGPPREIPLRPTHPSGTSLATPTRVDSVLQKSPSPSVAVTVGNSFDGVGAGFVGPQGAFTVNPAPPDPNGAVGTTQFVEWVNTSFAVFDKTTGTVLYGPALGSTLWTGFGAPCETTDDGDGIAQYDKAANRWVIMQPIFESPYIVCLAVSTTSDAAGTYNRYAFSMPNFPDYPKLGIWPDGYYMSFNIFRGNTNTFIGGRACAMDRSAMLAGAAATQVCFQLSSSFGSLLPSDLDGATPAPAGSPNYFLNFGTNSLNLWKFHVDFQTPSNSSLTGPTNIPVAAFNEACGGGTCIPQSGTTQQLDSLADRLMYRLAYRNFPLASPPHESLVVNHSVNPGSGNSGIRWYELRNPGGTPTVYQQGTFAPDSDYRWMGSIAMDKIGDMLVGYSDSSSSIHPGIRYTGRAVTDLLNTMQSESSFIFAGGGSQTAKLSRWGDYSSMSIDPVDDCTFWYTQEYLQNDGTFNWSTRVSSASFPSCFQLPSPPTVYIDAPAQGSTVSGTVSVVGWAIDNSSAVGTVISSVQVKVDGTVVGTASYGLSRPDVCAAYPGRPGCPNVGYSFSLNTSTLSPGSHTVTLTATDSDTTPDASSSSVTVNVQATPPTVWIDAPTSGATVSGIVPITGWAIDNAAVAGTSIRSVQVNVDGTVVGTATYGLSRADVCAVYPGRPGCPNVGYSFSLNTSMLSVGSHTITATATDSDGAPDSGSSSVTVNVQATTPTVWIDTPTQGSTVSGTVRVAGWAIDNSSTVGTAISSVQVKADGVVVGTATYGVSRPDVCVVYPGRPGCPNVGYSFSLNTSALSTGSHTITVTATDSDTTPDSGSSSVTVNVQATPPTVWIDTPTAGATVSGIVGITGWAVDNAAAVGTAISNVQVKVDGTVVRTATYGLSRPDVCAVYPGRPGCPNVGYSFSLNTSTLSVGSHTITVMATDSDATPDSGSASISVTR